MRLRLLFVLLALLLLIGAASIYVATGRLHARLRDAAVAAARQQWGRAVRIDALRGDLFRGVTLDGVVIAAGDRFPAEPLFTADQVNVRFRTDTLLRDLLRGRGVLRSITTLTVIRPVLALDIGPHGAVNVAAFLRPRAPGSAPPAFAPLVIVQDGRVNLTDASRPRQPFRARLVEITGNTDLRRPPRIGIDLAMVSVRNTRRTPLRMEGSYVTGEGTLDVAITARAAPLAQWGPYVVRTPFLKVEDGTADADLHLLSSRWGERRVLDYQGTVRLTGGVATVTVRPARLREIRGELQVSNLQVASTDLRLSVDGSAVRVRGALSLTSPPVLDLAVSAPEADLATVQRLFFPGWREHLEGRAGADLRVTGPLTSVTLDGTLTRARGTINRQPLAVESSGLRLIGGDLLVFEGFAATAGEARLSGDLRLSIGHPDLLFAGEGANLTPEVVRRGGLPFPLPVQGRLTGSLAVARDAGTFIGEAAASMGAGRAGRVPVDYLRAGGWFRDGEVAFPYLVAGRETMTVRGSGTVSPRGALAIDAAGTQLDLRAVAQEAGLAARSDDLQLQGRADAQGHISGTLARPVFEGAIAAGPGRLQFLTFDAADGPVRLTRDELTTPGALFREGRGSYLVTGTVRWGRPSLLSLTLDARDLSAAALVSAAEIPLEVTGRLSGRVAVAGAVGSPEFSGRLTLREGSVEGQRVDQAQAAFRWHDGVLQLDEAAARVQQSVITAGGVIDRRGPLRLTFAARGFDLRHLTILPPSLLQASGKVDLVGRVAGRIATPAVVATLSSGDLVLNGAAFDRADGTVRWEDGRLRLEPLTLRQGEARYTVSGSLDVRSQPVALDLRGEVAGGRLSTLLGLGRVHLPVSLDGRLDGTVTLRGSPARPVATVEARLAQGRLGDHSIDDLQARLSFRDQALTIDRLAARLGAGTLAAQGRLALRGETQLEVAGAGLDLDLLRPLLRIDRALRGTLDFTTQVSGPWPTPEVGLSLEVRGGAINGLQFDSLVANAFYKNGELHVEQALLSENGHRAKGVGTIPVDLGRFALVPDKPMNFDVRLVESNLSLLAFLLPSVEDAQGRLEGQIVIGGTPRTPDMTGRLSARDGRIKLRVLGDWLEGVRADVAFSADRLTLQNFSARLGGGTVSAAGSLAITGFRPGTIERLSLQARSARVTLKPLYAGEADADLTLSGSLRNPAQPPTLTGRVVLKNGDLVATGAAGGGGWRGPDVRLEGLQFESGENLAVHLGRLRVEVTKGSAVFAGGSLRQPALNGELVAEQGSVTVFGRTFALREGQARFLPQLGITPVISFQAETQINETRVFIECAQCLPDEVGERLTLRSDPVKSRQEIVALLTGQTEVAGLTGGELQAMLGAELGRVLFGDVQEAVARAFGLTELTIRYDFARSLQLRIGRLLLQNLYVTLSSEFGNKELGGKPRFIWALEWRFARNVMLTFDVDNFGQSDILLRYAYRF